jgi:heat-inducible transcriptional repressor
VAEIDLDRRSRQVLQAIIRRFLEHGEPVGSRTVAREMPENVSPATVRNHMADLEEMGLLIQPHTSAGRVPTDLAYRLYVDSLTQVPRLTRADRRLVEKAFRDLDGNVDEVLEKASRFLSDLSNQIGVVMRSRLDEFEMRRIDFVNLGNGRVLALMVSVSGVVSQKMVHLDEDLSQEELDRVGRYLSENFEGMNLRQIRARLLELMAEEKALYDRLLAKVLEVSRRYFEQTETDHGALYVEGAFHLLGQPEFADAERMRGLFRTFEEKGRLVGILNRCMAGEGVTVRIGSEHGDPDMHSTSLIAAPYFFGERVLGSLGIIGPTRMEYPRMIAMVGYIGQLLSDRLSESSR